MWNQEDFVTGERLQALADVSVITPWVEAFHTSLASAGVKALARFPGSGDELSVDAEAMAELRGRRSIFVYTHLLGAFLAQVLPRLDHRFVLVTHNSDAVVDNRFAGALEDPRIGAWFAQNALFAHPKLTPLPIGVANAQWPHGDLAALAATRRRLGVDRRNHVYCNFNVGTNPSVRGPLLSRLHGRAGVWHAPARPFASYLDDMASCRWCISPPGHGADCHRTWEALYLGTVPIVRRGEWARPLYAGMPVLELDELGDIDPAALPRDVPAEESALDRLRLTHWRERVDRAVAEVS